MFTWFVKFIYRFFVWNETLKTTFAKLNSLFENSGNDVNKWILVKRFAGVSCIFTYVYFNTLRAKQDGRCFPDDIFKCIFLHENVWLSIKISLKFVPDGQINNISILFQIMAWRRSSDKPLSIQWWPSLLTHLCSTRPHWVNYIYEDREIGDWLIDPHYLIGRFCRITCRSLEVKPKCWHIWVLVCAISPLTALETLLKRISGPVSI